MLMMMMTSLGCVAASQFVSHCDTYTPDRNGHKLNQLLPGVLSPLRQSCPWVGSTHAFDWVESGRVEIKKRDF